MAVNHLMLSGVPFRCGNHFRYTVSVDGIFYFLSAKSLKYLFALAFSRYTTACGWVHKQDIEPGQNQIKYMYQLRKELNSISNGFGLLVENDGNCCYRLNMDRSKIWFDLDRLSEFPDYDVAHRVEILRRFLSDQQQDELSTTANT